MTFRADLHCHSRYSDGTNTPRELIDLALEKGLSGLSITDHDTVEAYSEAIPYAKERGLLLLTGVEFSSSFRGEPIHILGYGISLENKELLQLCTEHCTRRYERNLVILEKLRGLGYPLDSEKLATKNHIIGRPHIALALIEAGAVSSVKEAFVKYLGEGKLAYTSGKVIEVEETIKTIHQAGGKAILAHPQLIRKKSVFRKVLTYNFDGLEGFYARLPAHREREFIAIAQERNWIITGGSDYHGTVKPQAQLGSSWVDEETFYALDTFSEK